MLLLVPSLILLPPNTFVAIGYPSFYAILVGSVLGVASSPLLLAIVTALFMGVITTNSRGTMIGVYVLFAFGGQTAGIALGNALAGADFFQPLYARAPGLRAAYACAAPHAVLAMRRVQGVVVASLMTSVIVFALLFIRFFDHCIPVVRVPFFVRARRRDVETKTSSRTSRAGDLACVQCHAMCVCVYV
jgi:hypothetical protein